MPFRELNLDLENKEKNIGMGMDVTQKCQAKCPTCFYDEREDAPKEMPFGLFKEIVDEAEQNDFQELYLLGGEPTLHNDIMGLLDYAVDKNQFNPIILATNGLKFADEEFCKSIADKGVMVFVQRHVILECEPPEAREKHLCIVDDEYNEVLQNYLARAEKVQDTVMGIKWTLPITEFAFKNIERCFKPEKVGIQCCITRPVLTDDQIFNVYKYARMHGYDVVMECTKAGSHFPRGNPSDVTPEELLGAYKRFEEIDEALKSRYGSIKPASILTPQAYGKTCHMPETGVHALIDGTIVPCVGQPYALGKIPEDKLKDILKSDKRKFFQYPEKRIEGHCGECNDLKDCTGGCRGDAYYITGCFNASAVQCPQIADYAVKLKVEDFVPHDCNGCAMENDSACGIKPELKETLNRYLGEKFAG